MRFTYLVFLFFFAYALTAEQITSVDDNGIKHISAGAGNRHIELSYAYPRDTSGDDLPSYATIAGSISITALGALIYNLAKKRTKDIKCLGITFLVSGVFSTFFALFKWVWGDYSSMGEIAISGQANAPSELTFTSDTRFDRYDWGDFFNKIDQTGSTDLKHNLTEAGHHEIQYEGFRCKDNLCKSDNSEKLIFEFNLR